MTGKISDDADRVVDGTEKVAAAVGAANYGILITSVATFLAAQVKTLTNKIINASNNTISNLTTAMFATNVVDTDVTLAANSDTRLASQKAAKAYVDALAASTTWTPTDTSGASLSFSNVDCKYMRLGPLVIAYGQITYPTTASGSAAKISLPVAVLASGRGSIPAAVDSTVTNGLRIQASGGTSNAIFGIVTTGASATNANLTGQTIHFCLIYPAT